MSAKSQKLLMGLIEFDDVLRRGISVGSWC